MTRDLSERTTACCVEISGVYPDSTPDLIEVAKQFAEQPVVKYIEIMIIQHEMPLMIFYYSKKDINNDIINDNLSYLSQFVPYCIKTDELEQKFEQVKNSNCYIRLTQSDTKQVKNINFNQLIGCLQNGASRFFSIAISKESQTCCIFSDNESALDATKDFLCNTIFGDSVLATSGTMKGNHRFDDISNYMTRRLKPNSDSNETNFKLIISQDSLPIILKSPAFIDKALQNNTGIKIGTTNSGLQIHLSLEQFTTHTLVLGKSGTGKTTFLYHAIKELSNKGIPSLIFDLNGSFSKLIKCTDLKNKLRIFKFKSKAAPCPISLFQLPGFCSVGEYKTQISNLFFNVFDLGEHLNQIVREVINNIYSRKRYLNDDKGVNDNGYPSYADFEDALEEKISNSGYSLEQRLNFRAAISNRISTLKECLGDYMGLEIEDLLQDASIIALNNVDDDIKPIILLYILKMLELYLKSESNKLNQELNAVCVIDEAHILFGNKAKNVQSLTNYITDLLNEMRQYGLGFILSDQRYSIMEAVYNSTDTHIIYNIEDGRETIASKLGINNVNIIKNLKTGNAILSTKASSGSKINPIPLYMEYLDSQGGNVTENDLSGVMESYWNRKSTNEIKPYRNCNCNKKHCDIRLKESVLEKWAQLKRQYTYNYIRNNTKKHFEPNELSCFNAICPQIKVDEAVEVKSIADEVMQEAKKEEYDNIRNDKASLLKSIFDKLYHQKYAIEFKNLVYKYLNDNYLNWNTQTK